MQARTTVDNTLRELAQRRSDGIEVTLLWNEHTDRLTVTVHEARTSDFFELRAVSDRTLDVFYHPFAYAA